MSQPIDLHNSPHLDPLDEPLDPELAENIARIKIALRNINLIWDSLRHKEIRPLRSVPTDEDMIAMAEEDEEFYRRGFFGPEPPDHVLERIQLNEILEKEGVIMAKLTTLPSTPAGDGSQTTIGYRVEARNSIYEHTQQPYLWGDKAFTHLWTEVEFCSGYNPAGVPQEDYPWEGLPQHRLLPYESAVALAYTFLAQRPQWSALEVRLVGYKLETSFSLSSLGPVDMVIKREYKLPEFVSMKEIKEDKDV